MQEQNKPKKNHWTQTKVDNANKKISQEIYQRNRQAPIHIKIDDLAIFINDRITRRGIAKGLVSVQEDLNKNLLEVEKYTIKALMLENKNQQFDCLLKAKEVMKN
ncbi:MAG: hypothetical protein ACLU8F_01030 [Clostridia bacterium]